jgi:NTE family protein
VTVLTPGAEDLAAMGANLMNPRSRQQVLETALRTSSAALADQPGASERLAA